MRIALLGVALLALAGCKVPIPEPQNDAVIEETGTFNVVNAVEPDAPPAPGATPTAAAAADGKIPPVFQGRWGLVPADCTSTKGDNKGLMTVEADRLTFYESRATIAKLAVVSPTELKATLDFSGEGQTWQQETPLILEDNGNALTRTAEGQTLRYAKCAA
ncbi:hypothetical protein M0208_08000 [Sphingomonas sp. SUN019]|uniref:hypothetical protein n=1 Tax=Sphingomonas sp. SUN019 TaxID=2937788 RepID=UPI0021641929|nr:hypothetical protein [Sphingomonas sp. SUN019]UVO50461.1 hypothetical protein M0208_08000 [Sphingomonas sp. SUN019]